jgi:hypothetical protein
MRRKLTACQSDVVGLMDFNRQLPDHVMHFMIKKQGKCRFHYL